MGQWSDLPGELLNAIEGHLTLHADKVRVRAVCLSWKSYLPNMMRNGLPWLLQAFENKTLGLFDLIEQKIDLLHIPELQGKLFRGSSHGWVAVHENVPDGWVHNVPDDDDEDYPDPDIAGPDIHASNPECPVSSPDIYLINLLTGIQIRLPPRSTFPDVKEYCADKVGQEYALILSDYSDSHDANYVHLNLLHKIVMSSSPLREDCVVVAIYGELGTLAWCKCNDNGWTPIGGIEFRIPSTAFSDVIFYKDRLHELKTNGQLVVFENIGTNRRVTETVVANSFYYPSRPYLVECSDGGLLMVGQQYENVEGDFVGFVVFKLDSNTWSWCKVNNIGDDMLFLGLNSSLSIPAHKIPGYKGNCIYFADEPMVLSHNVDRLSHSKVGVFNLADRTIVSFSGFERVPKFLWPSLWVARPN